MKISTRGKYAIYAMILLALENENSKVVRLSKLSGKLGVSKPYLEQIFSTLRKAKLVDAVRGSGGGYSLALPPKDISVTSVLKASEPALFEMPKPSLDSSNAPIEEAVSDLVFRNLNKAIVSVTDASLKDLCEAVKERRGDEPMFYL
jgi:Rrf2 family protein